MRIAEALAEHAEQRRVVYCHQLSRGQLYIHHQVREIRVHGCHPGAQALCFSEIDGLDGLVRIKKSGATPKHLFLLPSRQKRKSFLTGRTLKSEQAITVKSGESHERLVQFFATHALHRIAPKGINFSQDTHIVFRSFSLTYSQMHKSWFELFSLKFRRPHQQA